MSVVSVLPLLFSASDGYWDVAHRSSACYIMKRLIIGVNVEMVGVRTSPWGQTIFLFSPSAFIVQLHIEIFCFISCSA